MEHSIVNSAAAGFHFVWPTQAEEARKGSRLHEESSDLQGRAIDSDDARGCRVKAAEANKETASVDGEKKVGDRRGEIEPKEKEQKSGTPEKEGPSGSYYVNEGRMSGTLEASLSREQRREIAKTFKRFFAKILDAPFFKEGSLDSEFESIFDVYQKCEDILKIPIWEFIHYFTFKCILSTSEASLLSLLKKIDSDAFKMILRKWEADCFEENKSIGNGVPYIRYCCMHAFSRFGIHPEQNWNDVDLGDLQRCCEILSNLEGQCKLEGIQRLEDTQRLQERLKEISRPIRHAHFLLKFTPNDLVNDISRVLKLGDLCRTLDVNAFIENAVRVREPGSSPIEQQISIHGVLTMLSKVLLLKDRAILFSRLSTAYLIFRLSIIKMMRGDDGYLKAQLSAELQLRHITLINQLSAFRLSIELNKSEVEHFVECGIKRYLDECESTGKTPTLDGFRMRYRGLAHGRSLSPACYGDLSWLLRFSSELSKEDREEISNAFRKLKTKITLLDTLAVIEQRRLKAAREMSLEEVKEILTTRVDYFRME